jgi:phenylalanyl-tRNA synthetase alpha chain
VCDYGLTLCDLIGVLQEFFDRLGLKKLRFKPAFNPYTEPSMEIFRRGKLQLSYLCNLTACADLGEAVFARDAAIGRIGLAKPVGSRAWTAGTWLAAA